MSNSTPDKTMDLAADNLRMLTLYAEVIRVLKDQITVPLNGMKPYSPLVFKNRDQAAIAFSRTFGIPVIALYLEKCQYVWDAFVLVERMTREAASSPPKSPLVSVGPDYTAVHISKEIQEKALQASQHVTLSEHEWTWSPEEQEAMARYVRWASQRLAMIESLASGEEVGKHPAQSGK